MFKQKGRIGKMNRGEGGREREEEGAGDQGGNYGLDI